jgi:hypothetical protein
MDPNKSAIERAFELARSGCFVTTDGIRNQLRREGYSPDQVLGPVLLKQLRELISAAKEARKPSAT